MSIRAIIWCPKCGLQHIDEGFWATREHKTHRCVGEGGCGNEWTPLEVPTLGVAKIEKYEVSIISSDGDAVKVDLRRAVPSGFDIKAQFIIVETE